MNEVKLLQSLFNVAEIPICFEWADVSDNDMYESVDYLNVTLSEFQFTWKLKYVIFWEPFVAWVK